MRDPDPHLAHVREPRLLPYVTGALPVWLCAENGPRILWANAAGAALLGATASAAIGERQASAATLLATQVARLAVSLPRGGAPRLERLRGVGAGVGRAVVCACSRLELADATAAVMVVAAEPVGPVLSLAERVHRVFASSRAPLAIFSIEGRLIHVSAAGADRLGPAATFETLAAREIATEALSAGRASGETPVGPIVFERIGSGSAIVLLAPFPSVAAIKAHSAGADHWSPSDDLLSPRTVPDSGATRGRTAAPAQEVPASGELGSTPGWRRRPLRFIWQTDIEGRFTLGTPEFADVAGPSTAALIGRPWNEIARALALDPDGRIERAIASRETWSGITVIWPIGDRGEKVAVALSALPEFGRNRSFRGYRGFGVCRDLARIDAATAVARSECAPAVGSPRAGDPGPREAGPLLTLVPRATNVVPFCSPAAGGDRRGTLSPLEHIAFREIAEVLGVPIEQSTGEPWVALPASERPTAPPSASPSSRSSGSGQEIAAPSTDSPIPSALAPGALESDGRLMTSELALRAAEAGNRELQSILHTATDGVILVEREGCILFLNRSAEALFGYESAELAGRPFVDLFAPESHRIALDYLAGLSLNGVASVLNDGREVIGRVRQGGLIPLFMTMGRIAEGAEKFCAVFRDITQWKRAEEELLNAKRQAERASSAKSDFLAKVSHEIRTPLNAIIGISEVMMEERFGPIGNERYREYLKDIHASGGHLISLINDLLDLSKIEAGKLDLTFASVMLNELVQQCVALMQPQANRERIIIRTSLSPMLPPVVVDARSIRQIVLNLLSNSIKFTGAGGQVIVSTALTGRGEAVLRVRDTGVGMSEKEIETALEPFRQVANSTRWGSGGTGLGLPLTKALAEANRAIFTIRSAVNAGTLVEIVFPATRVLAE
jgi:PAS domain S-box-containing protein